MLSAIVWDIDPILIHFGDGGIRWYGLLWAIGIYLCYLIQVKLYKNENCPPEWTDKLFMWMVIGLIIGVVAGIIKEIYYNNHEGHSIQFNDFIASFIGALSGFVLIVIAIF